MGAVLEAAESGDRREELVAMRVRIAQAIDDEKTPARDLAALTRRQIDISREIEAIDKQAAEEDQGASTAPDEPANSSSF